MSVAEEKLKMLRKDFCTGIRWTWELPEKILLQNHLTFLLFNHVLVWPNKPELWPKSIKTNGCLRLNSGKMCKSADNLLTLIEGTEKFSANEMRLSLADAGDGVKDASFVFSMADAGVFRIYNMTDWVKEMVALREQGGLRKVAPTYHFR
ncbi:hypothetical protein OESDEN_13720 [Oesophagostomum dentatum]|uniref:Uncharacterized protein n=1 Tax=Oesophagostomum dentatum TaxID=61180 RepID=A0A0B1SRK6_OESDE|nr:hypothetical protein OESDEN_13720 [Oesophagostomum dentatum]